MTKDELKDLIKECLLEIIVEGSPKSAINGFSERKMQRQAQQSIVTSPALDKVYPRGNSTQSKTTLPARATKQSPNNFKSLANGNDIMAAMFADTASSGLVERLGSPDGNSIIEGSNPIVDTGIDPSFLEGSSNWATLAFSEQKNSIRR